MPIEMYDPIRRFPVAAAVLLTVLAGCGQEGPEKVIVEGIVSYQGQPVANGEIRFCPIDGTLGPVSGAAIKDGRYIAEGKGGVPIGKHRVQISAYRAGAGTPAGSSVPDMGEGGAREQYIPPQYSTQQSVLVVTVDGSRRRVSKDFDLK